MVLQVQPELVASSMPVSISDIVFNSKDEIFISSWPGIIYKVVNGNNPTVFAGGGTQTENYDGTGTEARFVQLRKMVFDRVDNMYIVSEETIRKVTPDAVTTTVAGQVGVQQMRYHVDALRANFYVGVALMISKYGHLYIRDTLFGVAVLGLPPIMVTEQTLDVTPSVNVRNTTNDSMGGLLRITNPRGDNAGVDNDEVGEIRFTANDSAKTHQQFANIKATAPSVSSASEQGMLELGVACTDTGGVDSIITMTGGLDGKSSTTTIAGNMEFNGDLKLDSGFRTVTIPGLGNPNLPLEYLELKTFETPLDFERKNWTAFADMDSDGNIIFAGGISGKIYKSTPAGEISVLTTIVVPSDRLNALAVDKTDNSIYISRSVANQAVTKLIKQGTVVDYNVTASGGKYCINGSENPEIKLYVGVTYRFILSTDVAANHPFFLTTSSTGGAAASSNSIHSESEVSTNYSNDVITFTPTQERNIYYHCSNHNMGNQLTVLDKLDTATGYSIDYEWTVFTPANGDGTLRLGFNSQGQMYCVTYMNSTLYSVDKYSGIFTELLQISVGEYGSRPERYNQIWRVQDFTFDKDDNIFCLDVWGYGQEYGAGEAVSQGYVPGRFVYKIDMTDPANPVGSWFTPGDSALADLSPKHANTFYGIAVDKAGNVYFNLAPDGQVVILMVL